VASRPLPYQDHPERNQCTATPPWSCVGGCRRQALCASVAVLPAGLRCRIRWAGAEVRSPSAPIAPTPYNAQPQSGDRKGGIGYDVGSPVWKGAGTWRARCSVAHQCLPSACEGSRPPMSHRPEGQQRVRLESPTDTCWPWAVRCRAMDGGGMPLGVCPTRFGLKAQPWASK
jgi:hypothetical protein